MLGTVPGSSPGGLPAHRCRMQACANSDNSDHTLNFRKSQPQQYYGRQARGVESVEWGGGGKGATRQNENEECKRARGQEGRNTPYTGRTGAELRLRIIIEDSEVAKPTGRD